MWEIYLVNAVAQALRPQKRLENYLMSGGFPRHLLFEHPYQLLQEYFNNMILRDVPKRVHARTPDTTLKN